MDLFISNSEIPFSQKIEDQNKNFLSNISNRYYEKGKKILIDYDLKNTLLDIPIQCRYDNSKLIPLIEEFITKRYTFLEEISKYLKD